VRDSEALPRIDVVDDNPCIVEVLDFDFEGGRIYLSFSCPELDDSDGVESCQITEGYAYFENCGLDEQLATTWKPNTTHSDSRW
jgi:hypothetical protein